MRFKIAGGVGEHGRNSFLIESENLNVLLDCGLMPCGDKPYPRLDREEIKKIKYLFLTHSHADHTGAIGWLIENGFNGTVAATEETLLQIGHDLKNVVRIQDFRSTGDIRLRWGRTGHCMGSVWYLVEIQGRNIFYSGDYMECSDVYETDLIRGIYADIAVLDSTYGPETRSDAEMKADFLDAAGRALCGSGRLLLPVPKYGRGQELLCMLKDKYPGAAVYADSKFISQMEIMKNDRLWIKKEAAEILKGINISGQLDTAKAASGLKEETSEYPEIYFISDPQLKYLKDAAFAEGIAELGGSIILTGTVDDGSGSSRLLKDGKAEFHRFPVHCTDRDRTRLENKNYFKRVIPFHSSDSRVLSREIEL